MENETNPFIVGSEPYMIRRSTWGEIVSCRKVKVTKSLANDRFRIEGSEEMYRAELSYHDKVWSAQKVKSGYSDQTWLTFTYPAEEIERVKLRRDARNIMAKITTEVSLERLNRKQIDMLEDFLKDYNTKS